MNAEDFKQRTGVGAESLRINHRRRFSLTSLSLTDDANAEEGNILGLETESFNYNYALIYSSGSGRHKRSSSLSSNSSSSSLSSPLWSPCNSASASQAAIPFSWEDKPGVPKQKPDACDARGLDLPLPPSSEQPKGTEDEARRSLLARRGLRWANKKTDDPFVTALVACTRQGINEARVGRGGRHSHGHGHRQGQRQGYSCMRACATVDAHIAVPRKQLMNAQAAHPISKQQQQPPLAFIHSRTWDIELSQSLLHR
ncbi:hypothetical protein SUGI_0590340 [Cryptomeria japonica]|uniref:uncharacterized protein LOC131039725 n=1 Tax=Cryptomeria japonica TaxID=3369 RepID=UPI002414CBF8|nr:uncharacterized protein LOC131039725 [Cryptomeria japonica]GLJ29866.1 hypothetical protein SUGI_0590340 [Cryptomeria japonica]